MNFTKEHIDIQVRALADSAYVIESAIAAGERDQQSIDAVNRNVQHLEIMLSMPHIQSAGADLAPHNAAIIAGKAWLAAS